MLRKHQECFAKIIDGIIAGNPTKTIICECTPGAGKSLLPIIAGKLITAGLADALCWIVPRKTLQFQGERNFQDVFFRKMLNHRLTIRASTNEINPCRGLDGLITTYQAVGLDERHTVLSDFSTKRYILVLDENQHMEENGTWHQSLQSIINKAKYIILMTGTPFRGSGTPIALMTDTNPDTTAKIKYSRKDALAEKAIIPLHFFFSDGNAKWIDCDGQETECKSIADVRGKDTGKALYTAISTKYAEELLTKGLSHWVDHKKRSPSSRLLVVTANVALAKKAIRFLEKYNFRAEIATSHESIAAQIAMKRFKAGLTDILVGVAMFYEGFSCKQVSHIISLTHIRSQPWLEQMFARAVRVDPDAGPYETQYAYIFTPDDPSLREVASIIEAEQSPFIKKQMPRNHQSLLFDSDSSNGHQEPGGNIYGIIPLGSALTNGREI
jgi:superfamily II DNA or RNA helicase